MPDLDSLSLYQTRMCPYCVRVRSAMERLGIDFEIRDLNESSARRMELIEATGRQTVPCLRVDHEDGRSEWLHESADIVAYLHEYFGS
jgi:glutathione S-transferase